MALTVIEELSHQLYLTRGRGFEFTNHRRRDPGPLKPNVLSPQAFLKVRPTQSRTHKA